MIRVIKESDHRLDAVEAHELALRRALEDEVEHERLVERSYQAAMWLDAALGAQDRELARMEHILWTSIAEQRTPAGLLSGAGFRNLLKGLQAQAREKGAQLDIETEAELAGKSRQEFAHGWLGLESFGRASVVAVAPITEAEVAALIDQLAFHFVEAWGAPNTDAALPVATEEMDYETFDLVASEE